MKLALNSPIFCHSPSLSSTVIFRRGWHCAVRPYIFPPPGSGSVSLLPSVEREIQMDIVLSPGINHIRCSSGEGGEEEGRRRRGRGTVLQGGRADSAGIFTVEVGF